VPVHLLWWPQSFRLTSCSWLPPPPVAKELLAATNIEDSPLVVVLTPELQLAIAFEVLHRLDMAERSRSLSKEEPDLVEFLVAQVTSLSSSLAYKASIVESSVPTLVACQSNLGTPSANPRCRGHTGCYCTGCRRQIVDPL
jgi:hypothetical protein